MDRQTTSTPRRKTRSRFDKNRQGGGNKPKNFRNSRGRNNNNSRGPQRKRFVGGKFEISSFINKAVAITEKTEHYAPEHKFSDFQLTKQVFNSVVSRGYSDPTPIQDKIIPHILKGHDVVGLSNTGTGKTAAFLIPLINKMVLNPNEQVIILAPTRELAIQIEQELLSFTEKMQIYSVTCVGGAHIGAQISKLRRKNHFIIGTPGRILDLMKRGVLRVHGIKTIVLDEADRMLDMGFVHSMRFIMGEMPKDRQTLFFSATMSDSIKGLIGEFLINPVTVSVITQNTSKNVDQDVVNVKDMDKVSVLHKLLENAEFKKVIVFGRTKHGVDKLGKKLSQLGIKVESIHGNKSHGQRQEALRKFRNNHVQTLVATDVAARGLDIDGITHVINFELPATYDDYIHRIGRTGRGNNAGKALTFVE